MRLRVYDYMCVECGKREERFVRDDEIDSQECIHAVERMAVPMVRLPPATKTTWHFAEKPRD
jgi:DNA-directed RNA polymerase subunit RPC12/RpoP